MGSRWISTRGRTRVARTVVTIVVALTAAACQTVKPWERGLLAGDAMAMVADPMAAGLDEHIYFAKEASSGGGEASGGGCGCN